MSQSGQTINSIITNTSGAIDDTAAIATAEQIGPAQGIPIFGLDALSSAAYGPEAALSLLIPSKQRRSPRSYSNSMSYDAAHS
jgi:hypothetical protein